MIKTVSGKTNFKEDVTFSQDYLNHLVLTLNFVLANWLTSARANSHSIKI